MKPVFLLPLLFCSLMASCNSTNQEINATEIDNSPSAMIPANTPTLTAEDSALIFDTAAKVPAETRANFERLRAEWKDACNNSEICLSSNMQDYTKPEQFTELVKMGEPVIPLVIEKMAGGDFFMQLVYEGIRPDEIFTDSHGSGQQRAADYVKVWIESAKRQTK